MRSRIITLLLTCLCAGVARANYNPVPLTQGSYTYSIVVPASSPQQVPTCINATSGAGLSEGDNTLYEMGYYNRMGLTGGNYGIPVHNTVFTDTNNANVQFLMPPTYQTNNDLQLDPTTPTGTLLFNSPVTATNLVFLSGGSGTVVVNYVVNHTDGSTDTGSINCSDWYTSAGAQIAWNCISRVSTSLAFDTRTTGAPYLYAYYITVSGAVPISSVTLTYVSGGHEGNFYAVSGKAPGSSIWVPIPVGGFDRITTIPASFPLTATMDQGTNIANNANLATWFEQGFYAANPSSGLPPSGSTFTTPVGHQYTMGNYYTNDAILIDGHHLVANIVPATPAPFASFAFLTAGGNVGGSSVMTNLCILQHQDGVQETNLFYGYDWFNTSQPVAYNANGRVNMQYRTVNNINSSPNQPRLFETYFVLNDVSSPVTNIVVQFVRAPGTSSTTYIMAVSASAGGVPPNVLSGASPATQTQYPTQTATFSVTENGTPPVTNTWEVESNGVYVPLHNGVDFNGSTVSGATTTTLTIADLSVNDGTNYIDVVANAFGSVTSAPALLVINTTPPVAPIIDSQSPAGDITVISNSIRTTTFSVTVDSTSSTPLFYQWFNGSTPIIGATNSTYVVVDTNLITLSCTVTNFVGSASSMAVTLTPVIPTFSPFQAAIMAYKPAAFWPLSETSGSTAYDYASTNDGTYEGDITLGNPGVPATAGIGANTSAGFDGVFAYVDIPVHNLNITGPLTLIQWVQYTPEPNSFETTLGHTDSGYRLSIDGNGKPHFADEGPDVTSPNPITDGNWHLLVGVYDGVNQHLYVDGQALGGSTASTPVGSFEDVWIGGAPDYGGRFFSGFSADVAILATGLTAAQVSALYNSAGVPPTAAISPANPAVYAGSSITLTAQLFGSTPTSLQWYYIDNSNNSNNIAGATNVTYTISNAPLANNGFTYGINVANTYGTNTASAVLSVQNGPAYLGTDLMPTSGEAYVGAPVVYVVGALGTSPIYYQWLVDGVPVAGATNATFVFPAECGTHTIQASFTNEVSGGAPVLSSQATLQGDLTPADITFNGDGTGWQLNTEGTGTVPSFNSGVLELTDGTAGEASSVFYTTPEYVGSFAASFTYTGNGTADGASFIIQEDGAGDTALGGGGGGLGYAGITNSIALQINLYQNPGLAQGTNGNTYGSGAGANYSPTGPVDVASGDPINVVLNYANGVLAISLTDADTLATYSTNYVYGPINPYLGGGNLAYVGFSGGAGYYSSIQTISNFEFNSAIPPVSLSFTPVTTNTFKITWPAGDPTYQLQTTTNLASPTWVTGPTPITVNGVNTVTVNVTGSAQEFFQLLRVPTCD